MGSQSSQKADIAPVRGSQSRAMAERRFRVLLALRDTAYLGALARELGQSGYEIERCHEARSLLRLAERKLFDVVLLDLDIGNPGGIDPVSFIRRQIPKAELILIVDFARIERAIDGIRQGAYFYLPNNVAPADVAMVIGRAIRKITADSASRQYEQDVFEEMAGGSPAMKRVIELVAKVAPTDSAVLLLGESGTGKELVANALHRLSPRHDKPFIAINCAALPENLLESEMFGHVKGAFTGAESDKRGLFEEADGGTILLDEIGDMPLITQAKLLRVLQNGEIRRVGASVTGRVDVRVVAATNRDLEEAVADRNFREDLYFRLNVIQIRIPPLRERMDALPNLAARFVALANRRFRKSLRGIDDHAQALLRNYDYPGNVRELESIIAHAVIMSDNDMIRAEDLPERVHKGSRPRLALPDYAAPAHPTVERMEEQLIRDTLERVGGNQSETAKLIGISRSTLWRKMKHYGIPRR